MFNFIKDNFKNQKMIKNLQGEIIVFVLKKTGIWQKKLNRKD
jgi:hypothetical protein